MGYHIKKIKKGILGESSKILEEVLELQDAEDQNCKIMALVELSDLIGAISLYLKKNYPDISLDDLVKMSEITARAFKSGDRS
jgi:hypothetical protein